MKAKIQKKSKVRRQRLGNLSMYPLTMEKTITAFLQVNPEKVDAKMEAQEITTGRKAKK
ncbi:MAG: hypothetical protein ILNGONEN_00779 [Syntrophorhabdaceae bacterium]|nr:hypothetical protein [Syntrophorhabdaceae bacterium]